MPSTTRSSSAQRISLSRQLTGAIVVALANINVGVFGSIKPGPTNFSLPPSHRRENVAAPMDDEYREFIKGSFADIQKYRQRQRRRLHHGAWFIRGICG